MIKFERDTKDDKSMLAIEGTGATILAELILEIKLIYEGIKEESEAGANVFRSMLKKAVKEDLPFLSDDELDKKAEKLSSNAKADFRKMVMDALDEVLGDK